MFKICNDKTYYVVQTTSEDVVVEIYTKKDGRGSGISLHEMHLDLCRAIRKLQHDGYTIMKVYPAMGDRRESIDVLSMPEFIQSAKCPDNDVEEAVVFSYFESGATFQLPCKVNIAELSRKFPHANIRVKYADEDIGSNCGWYALCKGDFVDDGYPSKGNAAIDFACNIWGYDANAYRAEMSLL